MPLTPFRSGRMRRAAREVSRLEGVSMAHALSVIDRISTPCLSPDHTHHHQYQGHGTQTHGGQRDGAGTHSPLTVQGLCDLAVCHIHNSTYPREARTMACHIWANVTHTQGERHGRESPPCPTVSGVSSGVSVLGAAHLLRLCQGFGIDTSGRPLLLLLYRCRARVPGHLTLPEVERLCLYAHQYQSSMSQCGIETAQSHTQTHPPTVPAHLTPSAAGDAGHVDCPVMAVVGRAVRSGLTAEGWTWCLACQCACLGYDLHLSCLPSALGLCPRVVGDLLSCTLGAVVDIDMIDTEAEREGDGAVSVPLVDSVCRYLVAEGQDVSRDCFASVTRFIQDWAHKDLSAYPPCSPYHSVVDRYVMSTQRQGQTPL
ncbi:hypothetical protein KIPB_009869 [Kipferlia bialata]|uniref:Uncharacterized protein n=1 Tax=Kipferlia bialata TaxID=797122 RepID=A0A9K3D2X8_9EUKA|nr:hypothetical protein KIPB_009869 [Kipferlia bialata]|eukprot:g9869.t1